MNFRKMKVEGKDWRIIKIIYLLGVKCSNLPELEDMPGTKMGGHVHYYLRDNHYNMTG